MSWWTNWPKICSHARAYVRHLCSSSNQSVMSSQSFVLFLRSWSYFAANNTTNAIYRVLFWIVGGISRAYTIAFISQQVAMFFYTLRFPLQCCGSFNVFNVIANMPLEPLHIKSLPPSKQETWGLLLGSSFGKNWRELRFSHVGYVNIWASSIC